MSYTPEWENYDYKRQEIIVTPGKPVTITLPEDRIASTYDGAKLIYEWGRSLGDSYYTLESGVGLTSITFTPEADWDGNWVYVYVKDVYKRQGLCLRRAGQPGGGRGA